MKKNLHNTTYVDHVAPGTIAMWSGSQNTIPQGWYICNGATITQNGKQITLPDLTNRFIQGSPNDAQLGDVGGANQLSLTIDNMPKDWPQLRILDMDMAHICLLVLDLLGIEVYLAAMN